MKSELNRNSFLEVIKYTNQYDGLHPYGIDEYWYRNQRLLYGDGKKRSAEEKRQNHYELIKNRIYLPLSGMSLLIKDYNNHQNALKLSYGLADLRSLPEYASAIEHMDHDISKDVLKPDQLEEQVKRLNSDIDDYFNNRIRDIISQQLRSKFKDIKITDSGEELPYYTVSFYGLVPKLIRFWIEKVDFTVSCKDGFCRLDNYVNFASISALSGSKMIETINEIKNNTEILNSVVQFRDRRKTVLEQSNILSSSINKEIIFQIEHQRYKTRCKDCKKYSRWF